MPVGQLNSFDPRHKHSATKVSKGERVSISLYTPTRLAALSDDLWQELHLLGFDTEELMQEVQEEESTAEQRDEAENLPEEDTTPPKVEAVTPEELELPEEISDLEKALTQVESKDPSHAEVLVRSRMTSAAVTEIMGIFGGSLLHSRVGINSASWPAARSLLHSQPEMEVITLE
eukprot:6491106-Amphidinium_carterae.4